MSGHGIELLETAACLADRLNVCSGPGPRLDSVLNVLLEALPVDNCALYTILLNYTDADIYAKLSSRRQKSTQALKKFNYPDQFEVSILSHSINKQLDSGNIVNLSGSEPEGFPLKHPGCIVPIRGDGHRYGILVFAGTFNFHLQKELSAFFELAAKLFTSWFTRLHVEGKLACIIDFLPYPTMIQKADGQVESWNPAFEERTRLSAAQVVGTTDYTHALPFYGQRRPCAPDLLMRPDSQWESTYHEFNRQAGVVTGLAHCPAMAGGGIFLTYKTALLHDSNNRMAGAIHVVRDVTHEREVEIELRRSEQKYRRITKFSSIGILLMSKEAIVYYNEFITELFREHGLNISLKNFIQLIHPEDRHRVHRILENMFASPTGSATFEFCISDENGVRYFRSHISLLEYEDIPTLQMILDDITEQKKLAEKARMNDIRMCHEDRLTSLGVMAAGIAHELNQPLNTVRMIVDALLIGKKKGWDLDTDELYEDMEMVLRQIMRMDGVIQNIRDFAREDQNATVDLVDVNAAVENIFLMIGRQLSARNISVEKDCCPNLGLVSANLHRLEQVIMNLLVNARQALEASNKNSKKLRIWTRQFGESIVVGVEDNASGIPEEIANNIFDPFFTTKDVGQGTGLGLSISSSILTDFGGSMDFHNNSQGGATFAIYLPVCEQPQ